MSPRQMATWGYFSQEKCLPGHLFTNLLALRTAKVAEYAIWLLCCEAHSFFFDYVANIIENRCLLLETSGPKICNLLKVFYLTGDYFPIVQMYQLHYILD